MDAVRQLLAGLGRSSKAESERIRHAALIAATKSPSHWRPGPLMMTRRYYQSGLPARCLRLQISRQHPIITAAMVETLVTPANTNAIRIGAHANRAKTLLFQPALFREKASARRRGKRRHGNRLPAVCDGHAAPGQNHPRAHVHARASRREKS
jgi:hypothetical protein